MYKSKVSAVLPCGLGLLLLLSLGLVQRSELQAISQQAQALSSDTLKKQEIEDIDEMKALKITPTFGLRNAVADWSFVQFLLYFGDDEARQVTGYRANPDFFKTIIRHDPYFKDFYVFLSGSVTNYSGTPDKTVEIMDKGLKSLRPNQPHDGYYIWRYKAADELLFLGRGKDAQHSYEMAARWAAQSDDAESALVGEISQQTAQFLAKDPDSRLARINAWSSILTTAIDDATRERAVAQIRALGGDVVFSEDGGIKVKYAQEDGQDSES